MSRPAIFPYANLEALLDAFLGDLNAPLSLKPIPVVVPSIQFSDWLQVAIARKTGLCMGLEFLMPQGFIQRALSAAALGSSDRDHPWSKRALTWRLLPHIAEYLEPLGVPDPSLRDRFALAGLLADQFDQYGHFRPEMIRKWAIGQTALSAGVNRAVASESWQKKLWLTLKDEIEEAHPALELQQLANSEAGRSALQAAFPKLIVLGTGSLDPLLVEVLGLLADSGGEVKIHVVLPSFEYLGELRRRKAIPSEETAPEEIEASCGHPLLESMGRHAVGSFLLLGKLDDQYTHWPDPVHSSPVGDGLLHRLQSDIRNLRSPGPPEASKPLLPASEDWSLRVHSCFGLRREMEALRDEICRAFVELPGLKPEEIHIVAPSIEDYAPLVEAVLEQGANPLAVRLTELPVSGRDPVIEAVLALLDLARIGRFEASWVLELLRLKAIQKALEIEEDENGIERIRGWIRDSGLTQGLGNGEHGLWGNARDRLIAGRWFGSDPVAKYPSGEYVLPVADELGGDVELRDRFIEWHSRLESTMQEWSRPATAATWAQRLGRACDELLGASDDSRLPIQQHLNFLQNLEGQRPLNSKQNRRSRDDGTASVDAAVMLDWLEADSRESGQRSKLSGRISFGRLKQLQNIPCRVLAVIGMQEGEFPGENRVPAWDLLNETSRAWDRNARVDDRQLFLDAILTPADRLIITAANQNVRTGKEAPFSSCVDELLRIIKGMGASDVVIKHRLQPFAAEYYQDTGVLGQSFDEAFAAAAAEFLRTKDKKRFPFWKGEEPDGLDEITPSVVGIEQLEAFWKNPARAFLKRQGIALPYDEEDDAELDRSPIDLKSLSSFKIKDLLVGEIAFGLGNLERAEALSRANRSLPPGALGSLCWSSHLSLCEPLARSIRQCIGERREVVVSVSLTLQVTGSLQLIKSGDALFAYRAGEMTRASHFLNAWLQAVLAASAGLDLPTRLLNETNPEDSVEIAPILQDDAIGILNDLVRGDFEGGLRPLCFGIATSDVYAKCFKKTGDSKEALLAAEKEWLREDNDYGSGEGISDACQIAWRDRNPFDDPEAWDHWAKAISTPLREWGAFK